MLRKDVQVWEYNVVPDTPELAEKPRLCLTDAISNTAYTDFTKLLDHKMHSMNTNLGRYYLSVLHCVFG